MEPVSMIVTALVTGAVAGLKPTAEQAVKDAYNEFKALIKRKFGHVDLAVLEANPKSEARKAVVEEELHNARAGNDEEVLRETKKLIEILQQKAPETVSESSVNFDNLKVGLDAIIEEVHAQRIDVKNLDVGRNLTIKKIGDHPNG